MKRFVTAKKHAHISIASLHLFAQRGGELFCSLDTWYKYIRIFEWCRPWKLEKKEFKKTGIRASKPRGCMSPVRFLTWFFGDIFTLGLVDSFGQLTYKMAKAAVHAHTHNQISYAKFNKFLWDQPVKKDQSK